MIFKLALLTTLSLGVLLSFTQSPQMLVCVIAFIAFRSTIILALTGLNIWLSYTLFIVFLGGVIIIFIYTRSVAPKEILELNYRVLAIIILFIITTALRSLIYNLLADYSCTSISYLTDIVKAYSLFFSKGGALLYTYLVVYLLYTLICVVRLVKYTKGPLRIIN